MSAVRGLWVHAGVLYSVVADELASIDSAGYTKTVGTLNSIGGPVDFASNLTQLCVNDGSYLYVYGPALGTFSTAAGYTGGDRISFLDQRINFQLRGTQEYGWTAIGNATDIDPLSFASAEGSPDLLISHVAHNRELWLFGEESTEIHDPVTADTIYQRSSAAIDYGCVAPHSAQTSANSVFWLGRDKHGQAMVLMGQGHQAKRISTRAEEEKFQGKTLQAARAYTYSDGGQSFYCLNVPGVDSTLVYDETFGQWHERAEWNGAYSQFRATCHAFAYGRHYFGTESGVIYTSDSNVHTFGGAPKRRQRISPVISKPSMDRVKVSGFELVCEKGTGAMAQLVHSKDNGYRWGSAQYAFAGTTGQFAHRLRWHRLGMSYDSVLDVSTSDDAPFNPVEARVGLK